MLLQFYRFTFFSNLSFKYKLFLNLVVKVKRHFTLLAT